MGKIYFRTLAFNAEKTLRRCIDSVLNQTYRSEDIELYICDNASTDKTGEIIDSYAQKDKRVRKFRNEKNHVWDSESVKDFLNLDLNMQEGDYLCFLDADDAYHLDFLEKMLPFIEANNLDIGVCGYNFINAANGCITGERSVSSDIIIKSAKDFSDMFTVYHAPMRTAWGKVYTAGAAKALGLFDHCSEERHKLKDKLMYGADTFLVFSSLRYASRVGIIHNVLHDYYLFPKSVSHKYYPGRIESDIILYEDAIDFLKTKCGYVSEHNQFFLYRVYANAIIDTVTNIKNSTLSPEEKLSEYQKILVRPETKNAFKVRSDDTADCKAFLISAFLEAEAGLSSENAELCRTLSEYFPECAGAVTPDSARLFLAEKPILEALLNDNKNALAENLLLMIEKQKYDKQFDLGKIICALAQDKPLLDKIADTKFIRKNAEIYRLAWLGKYSEALDSMTDKLLKESVAFEEFFNLYLSIAAGLECVDEFIFGKIKLAQFYVNEKRFDECRALLEEISEMGVEDNEDITEIKRELNS